MIIDAYYCSCRFYTAAATAATDDRNLVRALKKTSKQQSETSPATSTGKREGIAIQTNAYKYVMCVKFKHSY